MLEFHAFDDDKQTITDYHPFCWMIWLPELVVMAIDAVRTTVELAHAGRTVEVKGVHITETYAPTGGPGVERRHQVIATSSLAPFKTLTRYEDREDYLAAKRRRTERKQRTGLFGIKISIDKPE